MAWNKDKPAFDIKEVFGYDKPEDLQAALKAGAEAKDEVAKLRTDIAATNDTLTAIKDMLSASEGRHVETRTTDNGRDGVENPPERIEDLDWSNPAEAIKKVMGPVAGLALDAKATMVQYQVLKDLPYYSPLQKEIDDEISKQPLQARCNPQFIKNCYDAVVGRHITEIQTDRDKKEGKFYLEGSSNPGSTVVISGRQDKGDTLSEQEQAYAKKYGMSNEEWIAQKKKLQFVS